MSIVEHGVAEAKFAVVAVRKHVNRIDIDISVQNLADLTNTVARRVEQIDLQVGVLVAAAKIGDQLLIILDTRVDEDQFLSLSLVFGLFCITTRIAGRIAS